MDPRGALYVPNALTIRDNLKKLFDFAQEHEIKVLSSVDAHIIGDQEFEYFPPHCIKGTSGIKKIDVTKCKDLIVIENTKQQIPPFILNRQQIIVEKQSLDLFDNINTDNIISTFKAEFYVIFGVATDYCVKSAALGLRNRKYAVSLVTDAVKAITPEGEKRAMEEMKDAGVTFITTSDVLQLKNL